MTIHVVSFDRICITTRIVPDVFSGRACSHGAGLLQHQKIAFASARPVITAVAVATIPGTMNE